MNFVSLAFLVFLVAIVLIYYVVPKKWQWIVLLVGSFVFYLWAGWIYIFYLLASIVVTYLAGLLIGKMNEAYNKALDNNPEMIKDDKKALRHLYENREGWILAAAIFINIAILVVVKYVDFICGNAVSILNKLGANASYTALDIALPLGLSFYTFQSIGYCVDVKRGTIEPQKNIFRYALFISFFPQLLQGPIGRYDKLAPQLFEGHKLEFDNIFVGSQRVLLGFFKKIAVADVVGIFVNAVFADPTQAFGLVGVMGAIGYAIQLFADFSGFMDIALGSAKMLGIELDENFDSPYLSKTIAEYWRRWHITLGAFFRDYIYYPMLRTKLCTKLLKSKHKKLGANIATSLSLIVTWFLIGLWHGANWTYILHGLYYGVIIILGILLEPLYKIIREKLKINTQNIFFKVFQIARTMLIVCFGYILFRSESLSAFSQYLTAMFSGSGIEQLSDLVYYFDLDIYMPWLYLLQISVSTIIWAIAMHHMKDLKKVSLDDNGVVVWKKKAIFNSVIMIMLIIVAFIMVKSFGGYTGAFIYYDF